MLDSSIALTTFVSAPTILYRCDACTVKNMAAADAQKSAEALEERRRERADLLRAAWASMPVGDRDLSMTTVRATGRVADPSKVDRFARADLGPAPKRRVITLYGHTGSGKTTLALAWVEDIVRAGEDLEADPAVVRRAASARHVTASELAGARKRAPLGREAPVVDDALRASALVIDELGGEPMADQGIIEEVVFARITAGRITVITTGLDREQIGERYRAGFVRRVILDKAIALAIEMPIVAKR
jgi:DNA replication protein DnaC